MAEAEKKATKEVKEVKAVKQERAAEPTYTVPELLDAAASEFGTSRIIVRAALTKAGKKAYTLREAKQLIERMKNKEVRA